jgi:hypothetical protein
MSELSLNEGLDSLGLRPPTGNTPVASSYGSHLSEGLESLGLATADALDGIAEMSRELESLGGGDTRIGNLELFCRVKPINANDGRIDQVVETLDDTQLALRDPRYPPDTPAHKAIRHYKVTKVLGPLASDQDLFQTLGGSVLEWLLSGFNASVIAYGQVGTGKTHSLFGNGVQNAGLFGHTLEGIFKHVHESGTPWLFNVGLSCWEVLGNEVIDLFDLDQSRSGGGSGNSLSFNTVGVANAQVGMEMLRVAQNKSANWRQAASLPNRAHLFTRIVVYEASKRRASTVHLVDLVGTAPLHSGGSLTSLGESVGSSSGEAEAERRSNSRQLLAFSRVIAELVQEDGALVPREGSKAVLTAARESRLTQILGPLLAANSKTFMLATLNADSDHYLETVNTLRVMQRSQKVASACMRLLDIDVDALHFIEPREVLGARTSASRISPEEARGAATVDDTVDEGSDGASYSSGYAAQHAEAVRNSDDFDEDGYAEEESAAAAEADKDHREASTSGDGDDWFAEWSRRKREILDRAPASSRVTFDQLQTQQQQRIATGEPQLPPPTPDVTSAAATAAAAAVGSPIAATDTDTGAPGSGQAAVGNNIQKLKDEIHHVMNAILTASSPKQGEQAPSPQRGGGTSAMERGGGTSAMDSNRDALNREAALQSVAELDRAIADATAASAADNDDHDGYARRGRYGVENMSVDLPDFIEKTMAREGGDDFPYPNAADIANKASLADYGVADLSSAAEAAAGGHTATPLDAQVAAASAAITATHAHQTGDNSFDHSDHDRDFSYSTGHPGASGGNVARSIVESKKYDSLLKIVREEQDLKESLRQRLSEAENQLLEERTAHEVAILDVRTETVDLRSRLRKTESESTLKDAFVLYDKEVALLKAEAAGLRERNLQLELQNMVPPPGEAEAPATTSGSGVSSVGGGGGSASSYSYTPRSPLGASGARGVAFTEEMEASLAASAVYASSPSSPSRRSPTKKQAQKDRERVQRRRQQEVSIDPCLLPPSVTASAIPPATAHAPPLSPLLMPLPFRHFLCHLLLFSP